MFIANFSTVIKALTQGQSVRRGEWEPRVRMFLVDETLMCQSGEVKPWRHTLNWEEITADDWGVIGLSYIDHKADLMPVSSRSSLPQTELNVHDPFNKEMAAGSSILLFMLRTAGMVDSLKQRAWRP